MNKVVLAVLTFILLVCVICLSGLSFPVKASGTIFIRADGRVEPVTAPISTIDNVTYTFTDAIYDEIVVERDNIVVDGKNYAVEGAGSGTGIFLSGRNNVTVKNVKVRAFERGIQLNDSSNNTLSANNVTNNEYGIVLFYSSSKNTLRHNDASDNRYNLGIHTESASGYIQDIDDSNTVNGKPVYYWVNRQDIAVPLDAGYVVLVNCTRITVENLNLANNMQGVALAFTTNSTIANNNLTNNFDGIRLDHFSDNNVVSGNNITANTHYGIRSFYNPSASAMSTNDMGASRYGSQLNGPSCNNTIYGNTINSNGNGIRLDYSSNNIISANNLTSNSEGIGLYGSSSNNTVSENNIVSNSYGIWFYNSYGNWIYHNNFIDNIPQVYPSLYYNFWDAGYPSGGNYWSPQYAGTDIYSGLYQNETGSDGIGDTPYSQDNFPLMKPYPWGPTDIGITSVLVSRTVVGQGYNLRVTVMVFNYGNSTENSNLTVQANSTTLYTQSIQLEKRTSLILVYAWNTTNATIGSYSIIVALDSLPSETDLSDNLVIQEVCVTIPGDMNADFDVDIYDIVIIAGTYGTSQGQQAFNPNCDIDGDEDVDIYDVVIAAGNYGKEYTP